MKKYCINIFLMLMGVLLLFIPRVGAVEQVPINKVIFSEVLLGTATSSAQEFIELYNNTSEDIDITGWHVQYVSATRSDWISPTRNISLSGTVKAGEFYLLASNGYLSDKSKLAYSSSLSQTGGHLRILDKSGVMQDVIGWGNAAMPLGVAAAAPVAGSSLSRLTNSDGYNLSQDNSTDFISSLTPTPGSENLITLPATEEELPPGETPTPGGLGGSTPTTPPVSINYSAIHISELLPNPKSPQSDSKDEYVELYNPNSEEVDLTGYILTTGINSTYRFTIKEVKIPAGGYATFYSGSTTLSLSNTSGKARLLAPDGTLMDESFAYSGAPEGQSWIFKDSSWVWSDSPTPNTENILTVPAVPVVKAATAKKATTKIAKAKASTRKSAKAPKAPKKKIAKSTKPLANATELSNTTKIHPVVLASVGSSALLYAMYEYRNDLANTIYKARRYRETRRDFWPALGAARASRATRRLGRWQDHLRAGFSSWFRKQ